MTTTYNVYCDESCHLENDRQGVMVLGAVWCPLDKTPEINVRLQEIKQRHGLSPKFELKWTKVSPAKLDFYRDVVDYFFDDDHLHFRALVVPDKSLLRHTDFHQTHDDWYYKMYFDMLKIIIGPNACYHIYVDIKDTRGAAKVAKLHEVLCNSQYDFQRTIIDRVQLVRSHEVALLQMADLLIGTVAYANRQLQNSPAKLGLVEQMRRRSGYKLTLKTLYREEKVNLFVWQASEKSK